MSTGISVDLRVCLYIFVSRIRPSVGISVHFLSVCIHVRQSIYMSLSIIVCLVVCPSICVPILVYYC